MGVGGFHSPESDSQSGSVLQVENSWRRPCPHPAVRRFFGPSTPLWLLGTFIVSIHPDLLATRRFLDTRYPTRPPGSIPYWQICDVGCPPVCSVPNSVPENLSQRRQIAMKIIYLGYTLHVENLAPYSVHNIRK